MAINVQKILASWAHKTKLKKHPQEDLKTVLGQFRRDEP